jgi:hypothetical protein
MLPSFMPGMLAGAKGIGTASVSRKTVQVFLRGATFSRPLLVSIAVLHLLPFSGRYAGVALERLGKMIDIAET